MTSDQGHVDHPIVRIFVDATRVGAAIDEIAALGYAPASIGVIANRLSPLRMYLTTQLRGDRLAVSMKILDGLADCRLADLGDVIGLGWMIGKPTHGAEKGVKSGSPRRLEAILADTGIYAVEAKILGEAIRRGATLVGVTRSDGDKPDLLEETMQRYGGWDVARCGAEYQASGWAG